MDHTYLFSLYTLLFCGFCKTDLYFLQIEISAQNDTALSYVFCHIHSHCLLQIQIPLAFGKWLICGFCLSPFLFFKLHFPNKTHYMLSQFPCKRPSWFCTAGAELVSPLQVCDFPKNPKIRVIHEPLVSLWDLWVRHPMSLSALLDLRSLKALIDDSKRLLLSCFFFFFFWIPEICSLTQEINNLFSGTSFFVPTEAAWLSTCRATAFPRNRHERGDKDALWSSMERSFDLVNSKEVVQ